MKIKFLLLTLVLTSAFSFAAHAQTMNDHQIAEILEEANDAEIDAAKLAKDDASRKEVKNFAKHMIDEHKKNEKETKKIVKKNDIDPEESQWSKTLKENAKANKDMLKKQKGAAFDKMYMEQQVSMHQQLLNDLDQKFIPNATKPEFKTHLQATREHVSKHLEKAKEVQAKL